MLGAVELNITADVTDAMSGIEEVQSAAQDLENASGETSISIDGVNNSAEGASGGLASMQGSTAGSTKAMGGLTKSGAVAAGGMAALTASVAAAGAAIAALGVTIAKTAARGDKLHKAAIRMGKSAEEIQRLEYAASQSDVSMGALEKAATQSDKSITDMADTVAGASTHQEALDLATEEYGDRLGRELLPLLLAGGDGIEDMGDEADDLGIIMSQETANAAAELSDGLDRLQRMVSSVVYELGGHFLPAAIEVVNIATEMFKAIRTTTGSTEGFQDSITKLTRKGMLVALDVMVRMLEQTATLAKNFAGLTKVIAPVVKFSRAFAQTLAVGVGAIHMMSKAVWALVTKAFSSLLEAFAELIGFMRELVDRAPSRFPGISGLQKLVQGTEGAARDASDAMSGFSDQIKESAERDLMRLNDQISNLKDGLSEEGMAERMESALQGIADGADGASERLAELRERVDDGELRAEIDEAEQQAEQTRKSRQEAEQEQQEGGLADGEEELESFSRTRLDILALQTEQLKAQDEIQKLQLQKKINELEAEEKLQEIKDSSLDKEARLAEKEKIQAQLAEDNRDIQQQILHLRDANVDTLQEEVKEQKTIFDTVSDINNELNQGLSILDNMVGAGGRLEGALSGVLDSAGGISDILGGNVGGGVLGIAGGIATSARSLFGSGDDGPAQRHKSSKSEERRQNRELARAIVDEQEDRFDRPLALQVGTAGALRRSGTSGGSGNKTSRDIDDLTRDFPNRRL